MTDEMALFDIYLFTGAEQSNNPEHRKILEEFSLQDGFLGDEALREAWCGSAFAWNEDEQWGPKGLTFEQVQAFACLYAKAVERTPDGLVARIAFVPSLEDEWALSGMRCAAVEITNEGVSFGTVSIAGVFKGKFDFLPDCLLDHMHASLHAHGSGLSEPAVGEVQTTRIMSLYKLSVHHVESTQLYRAFESVSTRDMQEFYNAIKTGKVQCMRREPLDPPLPAPYCPTLP